MWGSVFSFSGGRLFFKRPRRFPYPVTVIFGAPLPATTTADEARDVVISLDGGGCNAPAAASLLQPAALEYTRYWPI